MGLGNFHRAHQAWYTAESEDAAEWGIAAFTGRSPATARILARQDGLYTLIERGRDSDHATLVSSIVSTLDGADIGSYCRLLAAREVAIVTLTVTEPGYHLGADGVLSIKDEEIAQDIDVLRRAGQDNESHPKVRTPIGRLVMGLNARRRATGWPIAIVPCDNILSNGKVLREAVRKVADCIAPSLVSWIDTSVSFVSTSVDRITPRTTDNDRKVACRLTGWWDELPVVTEPFADWVLSGAFPAGRPRWETAGARFVPDVEPYERRKLWLLNGAHSAMAYLGTLLGCTTVADAIANPVCRVVIDRLWSESARHLPTIVDVDAYCASLIGRFSNPRMEHRLDQIGMDGVAKLRARVVPVALAELADGQLAGACAAVLAAWVTGARKRVLPRDAEGEQVAEVASHPVRDCVHALLALLDTRLVEREGFVNTVSDIAEKYDSKLAIT